MDTVGMEIQRTVETLLPRTDEIATLVIARCAAEIPAYHRLPASVLEGDLVTNAKALIELFLRAIAEGRSPTEAELELPVSWGAERARDGLPLEAVLRIYPIGAREAWRYAAEKALPPEEVFDFVDHILEFLGTVLPLVASAYLREQQDLAWEQREGRQSLTTALLDGRATERLAARVGSELAEGYSVVVYRLPDLPSHDDLQADSREATQQVRAIQAALDQDPSVLWAFERDRGVLLVPATGEVAAVLATIGGNTLAAVAVAAGHADIPRAHQEAVDVLTLAERLRRPSGLFRLADLAIEFQLAQPGPARDYLAALLDPVADRPHLLDALRAFVAAGYNRGAAASALTIHRNTLNYRLGRIHTLSGHDPTRPDHAHTLAAALVALDLSTTDTQP